jgi:phosphomannomutase / phosphoglucomutase
LKYLNCYSAFIQPPLIAVVVGILALKMRLGLVRWGPFGWFSPDCRVPGVIALVVGWQAIYAFAQEKKERNSVMLNPEIFRQYDIRGIAGKDMDADGVYAIGRGIGTYLRRQGQARIAVGRDCRTTSDEYAARVVDGLTDSGLDVVDIGVCSTPVSYFSIRHLELDGSVMVTASHNPPDYNGFKVCSGVDSVYGEGLQEILGLIEKEDYASGGGRVSKTDIYTPYLAYLQESIDVSRRLKVGIDAGNGTAGPAAVAAVEAQGCIVTDIYTDMDGTFPNHEADPTVAANMADLVDLVTREKLDVGLAFDGDGDRLGVVDADGSLVYGDQLMILFSREILSRKPGATFISEVKCSQTLYDDIEKHGGKAIMWKTGHSLIKKKMKAVQAELAGEMSGHLFFADRYFGYDDALYAALRLLEILADTGQTIGALLSDVPKAVSTPEIRVDCPDKVKFEVVSRITEYFRRRERVIDIDGVRVLFGDGWGLVRASNTQPALVLRFEALSEARLAEIRHRIESRLAEVIAAVG